jgi:hypothetical protein
MPKGVVQVGLRVPVAILESVRVAAARVGTTANAEMVRRLSASVEADRQLAAAQERIAVLEKEVQALMEATWTDRSTINFLAATLSKARKEEPQP